MDVTIPQKPSPLQNWCNVYVSTGAAERLGWTTQLMARPDRDRWLGEAMEILAQDPMVGAKYLSLSNEHKLKVLVSVAAGLVYGDLRLDYGTEYATDV